VYVSRKLVRSQRRAGALKDTKASDLLLRADEVIQ